MNMKISFFIGLFVLSNFYVSWAQNLTRIKLTDQELQYLAKDISLLYNDPSQDEVEQSMINNLVNYEFEIQYEQKPIYRGAINKPSISSFNNQTSRRNAVICLDYNIFDMETRLELAESKIFKLGESKPGTKYYWTDRYELLSYDRKTDKLTVNNKLAEKIEVVFFKTIY